MNHTWRHPNYWKELRKQRRELLGNERASERVNERANERASKRQSKRSASSKR